MVETRPRGVLGLGCPRFSRVLEDCQGRMGRDSAGTMRPLEATTSPLWSMDEEREEGSQVGRRFDVVVADASWSWTQRLFSPLADLGNRVLLIKACDWRNAIIHRKPAREWLCPGTRLGPSLWQRDYILPPGWMKSYPRIGMAPLALGANRWRKGMACGRPLVLAVSYPHYLYLSNYVKPDVLVYYNMDDYGFYWKNRGASVRRLERRVVRRADLSIFCARIRAEETRMAIPEAYDRIVHLPHGAPASDIAESPQHSPASAPAELAGLPRPYFGFVGTLEDRIDWSLIEYISITFPEATIVLIGRPPALSPKKPWHKAFLSAAARPNVKLLGWRASEEIGRYTAAFDVCLIPYRADDPFNRAACPTKVMDYMAASRPVVSTPLPECQLYSHLFDLAVTPQAFVEALSRIVRKGSDDGKARLRWETVRAATWERTAMHLNGLLENAYLRSVGGSPVKRARDEESLFEPPHQPKG